MARYYVQVPKCGSEKARKAATKAVSAVGKVHDSGFGTSVDAKAAWFEVAVRAGSIAELRAAFGEFSDRIAVVVEIAPGEGKLQSRQLALFKGF